jgi:hypothetical protein
MQKDIKIQLDAVKRGYSRNKCWMLMPPQQKTERNYDIVIAANKVRVKCEISGVCKRQEQVEIKCCNRLQAH